MTFSSPGNNLRSTSAGTPRLNASIVPIGVVLNKLNGLVPRVVAPKARPATATVPIVKNTTRRDMAGSLLTGAQIAKNQSVATNTPIAVATGINQMLFGSTNSIAGNALMDAIVFARSAQKSHLQLAPVSPVVSIERKTLPIRVPANAIMSVSRMRDRFMLKKYGNDASPSINDEKL